MRRQLFIAIASAAVMLLSSCSSDRDMASVSGTEPSKVILTLSTGQTAHAGRSRVSGGTLPETGGLGTAEGTLNQVAVGLFSADGSLVTFFEYTYTSGENPVTITTSTAATQMMVVANAPADAFKGQLTLDAFKSVVQDLAYTTSATGSTADATPTEASSQHQTALPMSSSEKPVTWGTATKVDITATLSRLVARVALVSLDYTHFSGAYTGASFTPEEVFMYHVHNSLTDWSAGTATGDVSGEYGAGGTTNYLGSGTISTFTPPYYFYVFPHSTTSPTKLVVKGKLTVDGTTRTTYYPIIVYHGNTQSTVGSGGTDSQIDANTTYAITATINGVGTDSPADDISPASVSATVAIGDMTEVTINNQF